MFLSPGGGGGWGGGVAERRHDVPVDGVVVEDEDLNVPVHGVGDHGEAPVRAVRLLLPANPLQQSYILKGVNNENVGRSERWQMLGNGVRPWCWVFLFLLKKYGNTVLFCAFFRVSFYSENRKVLKPNIRMKRMFLLHFR